MSQIEPKGLDGDTRWAGRSEAVVDGSGGDGDVRLSTLTQRSPHPVHTGHKDTSREPRTFPNTEQNKPAGLRTTPS